MKKLILILAFLFSPLICNAETIQAHFSGGTTTAIGTSGNNFFDWDSGGALSTTEANRFTVSPTAGTVIRMKVRLTTAPNNGAGSQTVTVAMRINGGTASTTCTITEAETGCETDTSSTYTAGQHLSIIQTAANTPAASNMTVWFWTVDNTNNQTIYVTSSGATTQSTSAVSYHGIGPQTGGGTTTEGFASVPMPFAGTVMAIYAETSIAPANGAGTQRYAMAVQINGSASTSTCNIDEAATTCNDTTHNPTFNAGDTLSISGTPSGTPTAAAFRFGVLIANTVGGFAILGLGDEDNASQDGTTTNYRYLTGSGGWNATETNRQQDVSQMQVKAMYMRAMVAPANGAGTQRYACTLRKDAADTGCTCNIDEAATTCNSTCTPDDILVGTKMDIKSAPSGTPAVSGLRGSLWCYINPRDFFMVN